ncbi:hypothetical protein BC30048_p2023 (plasmid) [Bacillus cereus]|jgi:hypothetical protein|uniref:hypothetical protein n=1 Tax=Bacillus cereus TaxID=1396 RepID=UPI001F28E937|nr:hypothetical protein [Bacillus cereus]BCC15011.1 hypothetical protein BCM0074_p1015 [Bacillus cereus]BCD02848.1 hypothetical protein BC30048_p2023 [Bacillus cereus]
MKDKYLIKIEGKGLTLEEIADSYYELIDSDFNMTINDMANYLRCSYDYIQKNIAPYVHHLYINSVANKALVQNYNDSEYFNLFTKRKLFSRMDFQDFILRESVLLLTKERYYIDDLHEDTREVLSGLVEKSDEKTNVSRLFETIVKQQVAKLYSPNELNSSLVRERKLSVESKQLYSLKDLLAGIEDWNLHFNYKVEVFRYLEKQGIPKLKFQTLIRYRIEDLEDKAVFSLPLVVDKKEILSHIEKFLKKRTL